MKNLLRAVNIGEVERNSDMAALLYWVTYHDVLAQFSLWCWRHWRPTVNPDPQVPAEPEILTQQLNLYSEQEVSSLYLCVELVPNECGNR